MSYSVIFAEGGWDHEAGEPRGGRCLGRCDSLDAAVARARAWAAHIAWRERRPWLAWLMGYDRYPPGEVVVTGPSHGYVTGYGPGAATRRVIA